MAQQIDVVEAAGTDVVLYDRDLFPELLDQDPREVNARFARRFAQAQTIEDLFNVMEGNSSQTLIGRKVQINGVQWAPYEADDGIIPLAICEAIDLETGEVIEFATTSSACTMFIRRAELIGALGFQAKITSKKTRSGNTALNLSRV